MHLSMACFSLFFILLCASQEKKPFFSFVFLFARLQTSFCICRSTFAVSCQCAFYDGLFRAVLRLFPTLPLGFHWYSRFKRRHHKDSFLMNFRARPRFFPLFYPYFISTILSDDYTCDKTRFFIVVVAIVIFIKIAQVICRHFVKLLFSVTDENMKLFTVCWIFNQLESFELRKISEQSLDLLICPFARSLALFLVGNKSFNVTT